MMNVKLGWQEMDTYNFLMKWDASSREWGKMNLLWLFYVRFFIFDIYRNRDVLCKQFDCFYLKNSFKILDMLLNSIPEYSYQGHIKFICQNVFCHQTGSFEFHMACCQKRPQHAPVVIIYVRFFLADFQSMILLT